MGGGITIQQVRRCGRRGGGHHAGSRGTLAKALCLGKKTPEARARDGIVLSIRPACCCVYVHWGKMARRVTKRHRSHSFCGPVCGPPTTPVVVVVSPLSVFNLCAAHTQYHTQYPPTRTGLSRRPLSIVPASVAGSWWWVPPLRSGVRCSCIIIEHGLPPPSFGLALWHTRQWAPAQPPFCGLACGQ